MAATQHSSPPPNLFNIVNQNNNHHKQHKSKHGEQQLDEDDHQEVFEYSHHVNDDDDEPPPQLSCGSSTTSISSSPSHEFSFTVCSLYTSPTSITDDKNVVSESLNNSSFTTSSHVVNNAIDLSPADEIFLHGHLLPLHLLSSGHLSISPRSSTNSLDGFTLPITSSSNSLNADDSFTDQDSQDRALDYTMEKPKSRSFSLFRNRTSITSKSRKMPQNQETAENKSKPHQNEGNQNHNNHKNLNKVKFDLSNAIKQYAKLVRPLLNFKQGNSISNSRRESGIQQRGQTFSYSGNLSHRRCNKQGTDDVTLRGRFSAPASIKTSPTNSGMFLLEASRSNNSSSSNDSTMEELQAAIQAAIAHCKNSSIATAAVQDKI